MTNLTGQKITQIVGDGQLAIHTDAGWIISIEGDLVYSAADGRKYELAGDEPSAADVLIPALVGNTIQTADTSETEGLTIRVNPGMHLVAPPDDDFEAWNLVGPDGQRIVSTPGGKLAIWDAPS